MTKLLDEILKTKAPHDSLELLARFITDADATVNAVEATISEIRRDFNLL